MSEALLSAESVVRGLEAHAELPRLTSAMRAAVLSLPTFDVDSQPIEALPREAAETPFGNVVDAAQREEPTREDRILLGALVALAVAKEPEPLSVEDLARRLVYLSANTRYDVLPALSTALGSRAEPLWRATAGLLRVAASRGEPVAPGLTGEMTWAPSGAIATTFLALSGFLLLRSAAAGVGRYAFAFRRPAHVKIDDRGIEVAHRIELLGRVLRDREMLVPFDNLASITREVRYARAGLYAGLASLLLGTYFGIGLLVDGVRAPGSSPSLLGLGLLLIALGLGLDFALSTWLDSAKQTVRLIVTPRRGRTLCVRGLDAATTDAMLRRIGSGAAPV